MSEVTDLTVIEIKEDQAPALYVPNGLDSFLDQIRQAVNEVPDLSTDKGRKRIASLAASVSRSKTAIEKPGREYLKRLKEAVRPAEAEIKRFVDACDELRDATRLPLTEWEADVYLNCLGGMFRFAQQNGYIDRSPFDGINPLRKTRPDPDPLSREEYSRFLGMCPCEQIRNLWIIAVNTGMRHGEICALSWEDIDQKEWTITVSRNIAIKGYFTPPKTECGNRIIMLTQPAIEALRSQMAYTRIGQQHEIDVNLREFGRTRKDLCTFVFVPRLTARNGRGGDWYAPGSFGATWNSILKRAGIRHRRAYESRHTYACWSLGFGVNPNFVANQMGHASAQMVYNVYGKWMIDNNSNQLAILNANFSDNAPPMPHAVNQ